MKRLPTSDIDAFVYIPHLVVLSFEILHLAQHPFLRQHYPCPIPQDVLHHLFLKERRRSRSRSPYSCHSWIQLSALVQVYPCSHSPLWSPLCLPPALQLTFRLFVTS